MRLRTALITTVILSATFALVAPLAAAAAVPSKGHHHSVALDRTFHRHTVSNGPVVRYAAFYAPLRSAGGGHRRFGFANHLVATGRYGYAHSSYHGPVLQCVAFARAASGIELSGNAADWWENAAGLYQRGSEPEIGAVLNFRANGRMRMGHVAVVTDILNSRTVQIDHANWSGGAVSRAIDVVDVSPANDWSAVRVEVGHTDEFGSLYPTFGFIYNRPEGAPLVRTIVATAAPVARAPIPSLNPPPADLRPVGERVQIGAGKHYFEEVAEAQTSKRIDLSIGSLQYSDAPNRSFR